MPASEQASVGDAFHQAAVAEEHPRTVVHDRVPVAVEARREHPLRDGHPDGVREPLPERSGGGLDPWRVAVLGVARGHGTELAEAPDLRHRQGVAAQVEEGVEEHRAVPVREHEAVPVRPLGIGGGRGGGGRSTALRRCPPSPSASRGGQTSRAAPRPWPARGSRWRGLCVKASRGSLVHSGRAAQGGIMPADGVPVPAGAAAAAGGARPERRAPKGRRAFLPGRPAILAERMPRRNSPSEGTPRLVAGRARWLPVGSGVRQPANRRPLRRRACRVCRQAGLYGWEARPGFLRHPGFLRRRPCTSSFGIQNA